MGWSAYWLATPLNTHTTGYSTRIHTRIAGRASPATNTRATPSIDEKRSTRLRSTQSDNSSRDQPGLEMTRNMIGEASASTLRTVGGSISLGRLLAAAPRISTLPDGVDERADMYRSMLAKRRVLVVLDDAESTHFQFSYEKYLGLKELSDSDRKHIDAGEETTVDRTRRLFYVSCTRALKDLAVVLFTADPEQAEAHLRQLDLFEGEAIHTGAVFVAA